MIRISTRPDYIDDARLELLTRYNVSTVEIGAQSMVDEVLSLSGRGHSSEDIRAAVRLLKKNGIETGVHLMVGLPGDTRKRFEYTVEEIIGLQPDTVRIHPTIVFKDTSLAKSYLEG
ncbi:MAG: radical SAM protein, partial [Deltaproteobacteria bacterium]|nr:radical SAM protein [Deltaproteobacteria bacterium]